MHKSISYCGISCHECPAYIATRENDDNKRAEVAAAWSKMYGAEISANDINCNGCTAENGPYFHHCTVCEIRTCAAEKDVTTCAHCEEYICATLSKFFEMVPDCKTALDRIRESL